MYSANAIAQPTAKSVLLAQGIEGPSSREVAVDSHAPPAPESPEAGWFGWTLPPVRWGGSLVSDVRLERVQDQPRRLQQNEIATLKASSYLYQPWFALVGGGLGLVMSREQLSDTPPGQAFGQPRDRSANAVTGNGELALFPVSRFPFTAYFDVSDSRASGELTASDITSTRLGARQTYRPAAGTDNYAASYNRSTLTSATFGRDTVDALAASMNRNAGPHAFDATASLARNTRSNTGERTALSQLTARHSYRPEPELSIESLASASGSDFHLISGGVPTDNRSRFVQANTFALWRPEEGSPLYVTGGGRIFRSVIASNFGETELLTLSANAAATYALSRRSSVSAAATVTQLQADERNTLLTTQTGTFTHIGDPIALFGLTYTWNASANVANQTGLVEGTRQNVGGQLTHGVSRDLVLGEGSHVNFSVGQGVGTAFDTVTERSQTLNHNATVSWRLARDAATSALVSVLAADSRTTGQNENDFQLVNFQASGQVQFSRSSSAVANLTVQGVRQRTPTTPDAGFSTYSSGSLGYYHSRAFDVPRLRYTALYSINDTQFSTRLQGDVNAPRERVSQSFEQRFDYSVGRVAMRLSMRIADVESRREALVFFRMVREFGAF